MPQELPIRILGDLILRTKSQEIALDDPQLTDLKPNMIHTMYLRDGVGLAANQVGIAKRIVVIDPDWARDDVMEQDPIEMINPVIHSREGEQQSEEGCISLPDIFAKVNRAQKISYSYTQPDGTRVSDTAEGFVAVVIQHELDHLDAVVFTAHLGTLARLKILPKLRELKAKAVDGVNIRQDTV